MLRGGAPAARSWSPRGARLPAPPQAAQRPVSRQFTQMGIPIPPGARLGMHRLAQRELGCGPPPHAAGGASATPLSHPAPRRPAAAKLVLTPDERATLDTRTAAEFHAAPRVGVRHADDAFLQRTTGARACAPRGRARAPPLRLPPPPTTLRLPLPLRWPLPLRRPQPLARAGAAPRA